VVGVPQRRRRIKELLNMRLKIKLHRGQQLWLAGLALITGVLVVLQLIPHVYAALALVVLYFVSRRHAVEVQRQWERQQAAELAQQSKERRRLAALPAKKRKSIEKGKLKKQQQPADRCEEQEGGEATDVAAVEE
jgi:hypothetical protein